MLSTFTLSDLITIVLHNCGEAVSAFSSPLSVKAQEALQQAVYHIAAEKQWSHLTVRTPADSWAANIATITNCSRFQNVQFGSFTDGYTDCIRIDKKIFHSRPITSFVGTDVPSYLCYTIIDKNQYAFNPYPVDATGYAKFRFDIVRLPQLPILAVDKFECPDDHRNLLIYFATAQFATAHLHDYQLANQYMAMYGDALRSIRIREGSTTLNMRQRTW